MIRVLWLWSALLFAMALPLQAERVRVGFYLDDGFCELSPTGERVGIVPDWVEHVRVINDWQIEWVNCTWNGGLKRLEKGEIDLMVAAVYRNSRRRGFIYPRIPFMQFRTYLFVRPDGPLATNQQTLEGACIGIPDGYIHGDILRSWLVRKNIHCKFKSFSTEGQVERALAEGKVDAALSFASRGLSKQTAYVALPRLPLFVAVNPRRHDLARAVDRVMTIINDLEPNYMRGLVAKYMPWREGIRPLHDIARDPELQAATADVMFESAEQSEEREVQIVQGRSSSSSNTYIVIVILLVLVGLLAHIRLARALAEANAGAKAKANFLATMSHEIRTPLNAVVGFTELLSTASPSEQERHDYLNGIKFASGALASLIDDVLDLSKLEAGQMDVLQGSFDPGGLISEMSALFSFRAAKKGIDLRCDVSKNMPRLALRESCVRQMLLNLIGNSFKFTEKGSIHCRVAVVPDGKDTVTFLMVVRDTGCGIPAEKLATLFDPFVQAADATRDRVYKGTGLGLAIVKRLVNAAHGDLEVRSEVGRGTAFAVRIPHVKVVETNAPSVSETKLPPAKRNVVDMETVSCLLVDDIAINLKVLSLQLKNLGVRDIRTADSGIEALRQLRDRSANVVFTDLWMPEMSGEQLARTISANAAWRDTLVIVVTADADAGATFDMKAFDGVVTKPVTADKLRAVISAT